MLTRADRVVLHIWLAILLCTSVLATETAAQVGEEETQLTAETISRRWGIGFDSGLASSSYGYGSLALRYRLDDKWGVGLNLNPGWGDNREDSDSFSDGYYDDAIHYSHTAESSDRKGLRVEGFLYREQKIGRWLGVGPFLGLTYNYSSSTNRRWTRTTILYPTTTGQRFQVRESHDQDRYYQLVIGVRPTFTFEERLVLEARFGLLLSYSDSERGYASSREETGTYSTNNYREATRNDYGRWGVGAFGSGLGPGSVLSFTILF